MNKSFTITKADLTIAQYAIDTLTGTVALEDDVARGIGVLRGLVAQGAIGADLVAITGKSKSNVGRITGLITLSGMLEADLPGDGIMRANKAVNAAGKVKGLNFTKAHLNKWAKDGRRFSSWNAVADAVEAVLKAATTEEDEKKKKSDKTETERFADLLAAVSAHARKFDLSEHDVATRIFDHFDKSAAEVADEAADAAELAS